MSRSMRAAVLTVYGDTANVHPDDVPVPQPQAGEVLVKVASSPINPSDLYFIRGKRPVLPPLPTTPGLEGSGTVVESGEGDLGVSLVGKRVHLYGLGVSAQKMWAEYTICKATNCVPLLDEIDFDQGACLYVNPMTVMMFRDIIKTGGHRACVQDVANSALGKMLIRLCKLDGIPIINVVRSPESAEMLRREGTEFILDSSDPEFDAEYKKLCTELGATVGFDAIAGANAGRMLRGLCPNSTLYVYSGLSGEPSGAFNGADFIFQGKRFEGRMMPMWLGTKSQEEKMSLFGEIQALVGSVFHSKFVGHYDLEQIQAALTSYVAHMSAGKVLIHPGTTLG